MVAQSKSSNADKNKEVAPFLKNLRKMLDQESDEILRWTPNGRAFEIHDMQRMMEYVLPKYFKHRKYTSFQRQLNYFNFKKWTKSKAAVCTFSNDYFLRDQADLSWRISRKKSVPSMSSKASQRKNSTASVSSTSSVSSTESYDHDSWKQLDMAIVVPRVKTELHHHDAFPSPTDMEMMLLDNETEVQRYYNQIAAHPQAEDSLDWFESYLLPSLEMQPKTEEHYYGYSHSSSSALPSILRSTHYQAASYQSLPAPSHYAYPSTVL